MAFLSIVECGGIGRAIVGSASTLASIGHRTARTDGSGASYALAQLSEGRFLVDGAVGQSFDGAEIAAAKGAVESVVASITRSRSERAITRTACGVQCRTSGSQSAIFGRTASIARITSTTAGRNIVMKEIAGHARCAR